MRTNRNRRWSRGFPSLLFLLLVPATGADAQSSTTGESYQANDVVVVALGGLGGRVEQRQHVREGLLGSSAATIDEEKHLLEIQMNIVRETAKFGPVLLLAPDETTERVVNERCKDFQLCELLRNDRVRVKVVAHDGVWIRDFGPQIEAKGDSAYVVHWRYFDSRAEETKREKQEELETARLKLLETRQREDQPDEFAPGATLGTHKAAVSTIDDKLYLLKEYSEILNAASLQRPNDETSAYEIADAVLATPDFQYKRSDVALDGGNLFKLEDGRCLTTRVLLSRNKDTNVDEELEKLAGCKEVTYLDPLPGGVIEHIDVFALPVGGKRILLASYDLSKPFAREYWSRLSEAERELAVNAELAMERDAARLRKLGYEVIPVASPFPRMPANGHTYYPSVLNVLVRTGGDGSRQVLVPSYKEYETDIQASAVKEIREAFGPRTEIVTVEATEAAKAQGAVHCLTLTAPLRLSIFSDSDDATRRAQEFARKEQLDRNVAAELASEIPENGLQGAWAILEKGEQGEETPAEAYPQRMYFGKTEFQKGVLQQLEAQGTYRIDTREATSWSMHFQFPDRAATPAVVQWISKDEARLVLGGGENVLVLKRIGSELQSPFKRAGQTPQQNGEGTGPPGRNQPKREKATTSSGQGPGGLPQVQK